MREWRKSQLGLKRKASLTTTFLHWTYILVTPSAYYQLDNWITRSFITLTICPMNSATFIFNLEIYIQSHPNPIQSNPPSYATTIQHPSKMPFCWFLCGPCIFNHLCQPLIACSKNNTHMDHINNSTNFRNAKETFGVFSRRNLSFVDSTSSQLW